MDAESLRYLAMFVATLVAAVLALGLFELGKTFLEGATVVDRRPNRRRQRAAAASLSRNKLRLAFASFAGAATVLTGWLLVVGPVVAGSLRGH